MEVELHFSKWPVVLCSSSRIVVRMEVGEGGMGTLDAATYVFYCPTSRAAICLSGFLLRLE